MVPSARRPPVRRTAAARGAALNCRVVHNWKSEKPATKKQAGKAAKGTSKQRDAADFAANDGADAMAPESASSQSPKLPQHASEADIVSDDAALKILTEPASAEVKSKKQPAYGRRLGIFGFGSKAAKLPDASGS